MNRSGFLGALVVVGAPVLSGCASGGSGGGEAAVLAYRESDFTRNAELALTKTVVTPDPALYQEALDWALREIASDPGNSVGYYQAARAQIGLYDYMAADTLLEMATALHPPYADEVEGQRESAWINSFNASIGLLEGEDGVEEGIEQLKSAEMIYPRMRPEALINLGVSYEQLGRTEEAIEAFGVALEVIRGPRPHEMLARDSSLAASWLEKEASVAFNRAMLYTNNELHQEAADEYGRYLAGNPGDITALSNLAGSIAAAGMPDSAQAIYENLMGENLGILDYSNIGVGLYLANNYERAAEAFQLVLDASPQNRDALLNLTTTLYQAERWHECVPVARRLIETDPYAADHLLILARCVAFAGDEQEAAEIIENYQAMAFNMSGASLTPSVGGGGSVTGNLTNYTLDPGGTVTILVNFLGDDGESVGTNSVRVEVPAQASRDEATGESCEPVDPEAFCTTAFQVDLVSDAEVTGFYFQVVPPRG